MATIKSSIPRSRYKFAKMRKPKRISKKIEPLPKMPDLESLFEQVDLVDERVRIAERQIGDPVLARKVIKLQDKFPLGTLPELVAMEWLDSKHHQYFYQVEVLGGRRAGGLVPDFVLPQGGEGLALLVNGTYWHEGFVREENDRTAKTRLLGQTVFGVRLREVVEVWDTKLFADRDRTMGLAVLGVETGR